MKAILAIVATLGLVHASAAAAEAPGAGDKQLEGQWIQFRLSVLEAVPGQIFIVYNKVQPKG